VLSSSADAPTLHSFPTRRSSDLNTSKKLVAAKMVPARSRVPRPVSCWDGYSMGKPFPCKWAPFVWPCASKAKQRKRWRVSWMQRSEEHTSELQSRENLVCRLLLE